MRRMARSSFWVAACAGARGGDGARARRARGDGARARRGGGAGASKDAWESGDRDGVRQFRLAHFLAPAGRAVLEEDSPRSFQDLVAAGAARMDLLGLMPPNLAEAGPRAGDERFVTYTARRPIFEQVLSKAAAEEPRLDVRRGEGRERTDDISRSTDAARGRRPTRLGGDAEAGISLSMRWAGARSCRAG